MSSGAVSACDLSRRLLTHAEPIDRALASEIDKARTFRTLIVDQLDQLDVRSYVRTCVSYPSPRGHIVTMAILMSALVLGPITSHRTATARCVFWYSRPLHTRHRCFTHHAVPLSHHATVARHALGPRRTGRGQASDTAVSGLGDTSNPSDALRAIGRALCDST